MTSEKPRWALVYDAIRQRIDQGDLVPGSTLPPERTLAVEHQVSRHTVRDAMGRLQQEGVVSTGHGILGRRVRAYAPAVWHLTEWERGARRDDPARGIDDWAADMTSQGRQPRQTVSVSGLLAPPRVATQLDVEVGTMLIRRRRIRYADAEPVSIADSWFPQDIADRECDVDGERVKPILLERDIAVSGGFVRAIGINQVRFIDSIRVRMPNPEEAELLDLSPGIPVGEHSRIGVDDTDRRIRVIISVFPGDRLSLAYELEAG